MTAEEISKMLRQVRRGRVSVEDAVDRLRSLPYEDLGYAKIDHHRSLRQGFPEVIFARGKTPEQVEGVVRRMLGREALGLARRIVDQHEGVVGDRDTGAFDEQRLVKVDR